MGSASVPSIDRSWEGRTIDGKFALLECLGGSAGHGVFVTLRLGAQRAAIKLVRADDVEADAWLSQWDLARRLSHPHLMPIFETGRCVVDDLPVAYVVTECAERVLSQFIQDRPLKLHETVNILAPIADGLTYLHAKGFVHGRVKPSNVLVSGDQLKLSTDTFLVAASVPTQLAQPSPHDAPELVLGNFSPAADVWSLGMTIAEALTQQQPLWDPSSDRPPQIPPSLPLPFAEIVPECLRIDPVARCTLADIKSRLVQPPPPPLPTPEELVARVTQQQTPFRSVPPPRTPPAAAEPMAPRPVSKWRSEEPHPAVPSSSLFAGIEDANLTRRSKAPLVLGLLLVLAIGGFILVQTGFVDLPPSLARILTPTRPSAAQPPSAETPGSAAANAAPAPAATTPTTPPQVQPPTQSPQSAPATAAPPAVPADSGATPDTSTAQPAVPAAPDVSPSESTSTASAQRPGSSTSTTAPGPSAVSAATQTDAVPKEPRRPRNAPGDVANRVMPSISPEASASMRAPVLVVLRVTVNRNGSVADASYISPGAGNYYARIAQRAAMQWTFDPPLRSGRPQASVWRLRFYFSRSSVEVSETEEDR